MGPAPAFILGSLGVGVGSGGGALHGRLSSCDRAEEKNGGALQQQRGQRLCGSQTLPGAAQHQPK